ncbi:hypothetical protein TNCT_664861 [Trichonephila clavata]|uniref:Uncharacterized protein n=1 Tax=Trichonephila clavata TaxID=2740835 RepID=A0A8X6L877_TRICU|nr:hypothetical protein TNCT_664861 [Trichonephila clavata]
MMKRGKLIQVVRKVQVVAQVVRKVQVVAQVVRKVQVVAQVVRKVQVVAQVVRSIQVVAQVVRKLFLAHPSDASKRFPEKEKGEKGWQGRETTGTRRKNPYTIIELHRPQMSTSKPSPVMIRQP